MALTFERKPDKGGETNHIGCIGIAAEGAEPTVLLLRTGTDEARCKASGFLTKSVAPYDGTKFVAGTTEKGISARGTQKLAMQMGFYLDRAGLSVFGDLAP